MKSNLVDLVAPREGSTVLIYDVHASESGALAILDDLYNQIKAHQDKNVKWIFAVSTPVYEPIDNIIIERFPWVKKNWVYRYFFDMVTTRKLLNKYKPDQVLSLQNKGIGYYRGPQIVYLHLPFILTDHRFSIRVDGKRLWLYQNIVSKSIFSSLRKVDKTIVQTHWMKEALIKKAGIKEESIIVRQPDISSNRIYKYVDSPENRKRYFYPATAFTYKNHMTLLKAFLYAQEHGIGGYELILTIKSNENSYTQQLSDFAVKNGLSVVFGGPISREEVFQLYSKSTLVFPSYVESFGLPLLEAKVTGSPIIASNTPFSREILADYNKVQFFAEMDYEALGKAIIRLETEQ